MRVRLDEMVRLVGPDYFLVSGNPALPHLSILRLLRSSLGTGSSGGTRHRTLVNYNLTAWPQMLCKLQLTLLAASFFCRHRLSWLG